MPNKSALVTRDADGRPLRWRDKEGVLHAVEQAPRSELFSVASWWTRCGAWHIPNSVAWSGCEEPTCSSCRVIERGI
jgi:hypothetical protein